MFFINRLRLKTIPKSFRFTVLRYFNELSFEDIPEVSSAVIKRIFKQHNVAYEEGYTTFIISCPICKKTVKSNPKSYVNKTTGMFMCSSCKNSGQWNDLQPFIDPKKRKKATNGSTNGDILKSMELLTKSIDNVKENTIQCKELPKDRFDSILNKFKLPQISNKILGPIDIRIDNKFESLYFPLENGESDLVGYKKLSCSNNETEIIPSVTYGGILIGKPLKRKDTAVLVPSISDFLVLFDSKLSTNVVCLPNGVNNLPLYVLPSLEQFKKLVLWFGNDLKSWESSRHFAKKLGEKRCYFVRPSESQPLPHIDRNQDFKKVINGAHTIWHKAITTFAHLREDVLAELQNIEKVQGVKWKRFPTLTKILRGHRRGELTIITGPTGSGKTTFVSEYSLDLALQGVNTLWGSFEIRNVRLARTMLQQLAGEPLDEKIQLFESWADQFEKLPIYFLTFHGKQAIKVVMEAIEHATYVYDISHVIIDNVQFMMGISEEQKHIDRFWKQDAIIDAFRTFATRKNCHVTLVIHPRKERETDDLTTSSIFGSAKASQEADNVLIIQDKRLSSVRGKKYLQVAKNRYSGDIGIMVLDFDKSSLSYALKKTKAKTEISRVKGEDIKTETSKNKVLINMETSENIKPVDEKNV